MVLGACAFSKLVAQSLDVSLSVETYLCLALATWIVYTLDHLVDSFKLKEKALTERHRFHFKYRKPLIIFILIAGITGLLLSTQLSQEIILGGVIAGGISLFHLLVIQFFGDRISFFYQKEISVSFVFTLGVFAGPVSVYNGHILAPPLIGLFLLFFSIIYWNVTLFSWYELDIDKKQDQSSISRFFGKDKMRYLFVAIFLWSISAFAGSYITIATSGFNSSWVLFCWATVIIFYLSMSIFKEWFLQNERYRSLGDAMLCLPAILWII